ncbi:small RNA-binding protein 11, chloroplastic-like [Impatiens glandulifera]|uniref:small RNA-binding protein 11, chloroplastic-like n=1 Tax=Impatiens glandulifera TaxID=253017 RepID=UPI001FB19785|nr:small RNA-binding protein 11, chloroplastic-like [Impatiens glandulifera]
MAALRRVTSSLLAQSNPRFSPCSSLKTTPSLLITRRGIASKLYVGGLSFSTTEKGLLETFSQYGQVVEAVVVTDKITARSKGFGFVTFASADEAEKAVTEMDGKPLNGRVVAVDYARPITYSTGGVPIARGPPEGKQVDNSNDYFSL